MRRNSRFPPQRVFRGAELPRLLTMIVMLAVIGMLIAQARDPKMWQWLSRESIPDPAVAKAEEQPEKDLEVKTEGVALNPPEAAAKADPVPEQVTGPTDEDPEEADAIQEEFEAITDRTERMQPEEMEAYDRIIRWVQNQPISALRKRIYHDKGTSNQTPIFNDFVHSPEQYRGRIVELELSARLIRRCEDVEKSRGRPPLHEVWGFTTDSRAWLYDCVVIDLPKGMPTGVRVCEQVRFVGYFFKLQGYRPGGAKPDSRLEQAPMLIGRLVQVVAPTAPGPKNDWDWGVYVLGLVGLVMVARFGVYLFQRFRKRGSIQPISSPKPGALTIDEWINRAEEGDAPLGNILEPDREFPSGVYPNLNGHAWEANGQSRHGE